MTTTPIFNIPLLNPTTFSTYECNRNHRIHEALLNPYVQAESASPPSTPILGVWYFILPNATGDFTGQDGKVGTYLGGDWHFVDPNNSQVKFFSSSGISVGSTPYIKDGSVEIKSPNSIANSTEIVTKYSQTLVIFPQNSGITYDLSLLPAFYGTITLINKGNSSCSYILLDAITRTLDSNSTIKHYSNSLIII